MTRAGRLIALLRFFHARYIAGIAVPDEPHFDAASTIQFRQLLRAARRYLEYGAGGSTLLAARLGIDTITVESDRAFAKAVTRAMPPGARNRMEVVDIGITGEWGMPILKRPTARRLARWAAYPGAPFGNPLTNARFPDLVLVDGRFRVACALEVARQAAMIGAATTLCFDDYYDDRDHYHAVEPHLGPPRRVGRMAIFTIDGRRAIAAKTVAAAARDYR